MRKSFYHYLMKFRQPTAKDDMTRFANSAYDDHGFPKQSRQYDEISSYLEMNGHYLESMSIFDRAWDHYQLDEKE
ncbi:YozE family protein [Rossellomorea aquimaris]|uniref:YozE family protein n=1 Tax=Rossellomorea TaxID=2837508 RepID=UPI001CD7DA73|nr:YozE family protein [Rossellomorea aquimaris]MCA1058447.1 YozE family protein [Rossellomorea aquimaris]